MKNKYVKLLQDKSGRQIEGMTLFALMGIFAAIAIPLIRKTTDLSGWLSIGIVVGLIATIYFTLFILNWLSDLRAQREAERQERRP